MWYVPIILAHGSLKQDIVTASRPVWENIKALSQENKRGGRKKKEQKEEGKSLTTHMHTDFSCHP